MCHQAYKQQHINHCTIQIENNFLTYLIPFCMITILQNRPMPMFLYLYIYLLHYKITIHFFFFLLL